MLRQVRKDQPPPTARLQMLWQCLEKSTQHPAFGIVDSAFHGRARPRGNPRGVANHESGATAGKKIRLHDIDAFRKAELTNVFTRTRQCTRIEVGSDYAFNATPCKYRGKHTGTRANIEGN